MLYAEDCLA
jgi:hypothetical protein